ncbi:hypothetical protein [Actinoplanes sp. NPDC051494]|uniref:hypothetical protein n=1 Tax=Actinoplanes sp. NPDC051494 TaxID=3363907 RepID=UPI00378F0906
MSSLAERQAALVAALTAGAPVPPGFDTRLVEVARVALLRKRAGEVARHWPMTATALGPGWMGAWSAWAAARPTQGSLRDGWAFARVLRARGALPPLALVELATREATMHDDGHRRRFPALRTAAGTVVLQVAGRVYLSRAPGPGSRTPR